MSTDSGEHSSSGEQQPQRSRPLTFNMFDPGFNYSPSSTITGSGDSVLSPSENVSLTPQCRHPYNTGRELQKKPIALVEQDKLWEDKMFFV